MAEPARHRMTQGEFFRWVVDRESKHELVDGAPVMMARSNRRHDRIAARMLRSLGNQLEGRPSQPFTRDTAIRIPAGNVRYPDLGVDCGPFDDYGLAATEPTLVVEILWSNTRAFDRTEKIEGYKTVASLEYILLVDPEWPQARLYWRGDTREWLTNRFSGLDAVIDLPKLGVTVELAEIYAGLEFGPRPALVDDGDPLAKHGI